MATEREMAAAMLDLLGHEDESVRHAAEAALDRAIVGTEGAAWPVEHIQRAILNRLLWASENVRRDADTQRDGRMRDEVVSYWVDNIQGFIGQLSADERSSTERANGRLRGGQPDPRILGYAIRACARKPGTPRADDVRGHRWDAVLQVLGALGINASVDSVKKALERHAFDEADIADLDAAYRSTDKREED